MLLAFKRLKTVNLNNRYPSFALGKLEDTTHLTLVLNTTLSFTTQKQIVVVKKRRSSNCLLFVTALAIRSRKLSCLIHMILMYMQVISTNSTLHRSAMNVSSTEIISLYKPFLFQNVYCLSLTSWNPQVPQSKPQHENLLKLICSPYCALWRVYVLFFVLFCFVFCFALCKKSQNVNISQLLTWGKFKV